MSKTLYFSKVNLNSHIFNVYDKKNDLNEILKKLYLNIENNITYYKETIGIDSEGNAYNDSKSYKFLSIEKYDKELMNTITGRISKKMIIFINEVDETTGEERKIPTEHSEVIMFYFDVYKEIVSFHTSQRFGYVEINNVFKELINKSMENELEDYYFDVAICREGLDLKKIRDEITKIGKLETLNIEVIPPNPDDELLNNIQQNGEKYLSELKQANITNRSILFTSKAPKGLNIKSEMVNKELEKIEGMHSTLSTEKATKNGYVTVSAQNKEGRTYTSEESNPVKDKIESQLTNLHDFALACKKKVNSMINTFL